MRTIVLLLMLAAADAEGEWLRGNTQTHTSQSDGDSSPSDVARWYAEHGYDFLVITDHDKITLVPGASIVLIPGEEITDSLPQKPLHVNALGIRKAIAPQHGDTVVAVLQRNVDAVRAGGGIAAINHPNFGWAFGAEELLAVEGYTLLEIASGHPFVNMQGPPSVEAMWDVLLTAGRRVWGIAVDDSHHLKNPWDVYVALPGKAWIVVRAERNADSILEAIRKGDFYASTGVELVDCAVAGSTITVTIKPKNGARYVTQYIGEGGRVLAESRETRSSYALPEHASGYVRARVIDSNGRAAWTQPHFVTPRPAPLARE